MNFANLKKTIITKIGNIHVSDQAVIHLLRLIKLWNQNPSSILLTNNNGTSVKVYFRRHCVWTFVAFRIIIMCFDLDVSSEALFEAFFSYSAGKLGGPFTWQ